MAPRHRFVFKCDLFTPGAYSRPGVKKKAMISLSSCRRTVKSDSRPTSLPHEAMPQLSGAVRQNAWCSAGCQSFIPTDEFHRIAHHHHPPPAPKVSSWLSSLPLISTWLLIISKQQTLHPRVVCTKLIDRVRQLRAGDKTDSSFLRRLFQVTQVKKKLTGQSGKQTRPGCSQRKLSVVLLTPRSHNTILKCISGVFCGAVQDSHLSYPKWRQFGPMMSPITQVKSDRGNFGTLTDCNLGQILTNLGRRVDMDVPHQPN